jgi:hypothetical protein
LPVTDADCRAYLLGRLPPDAAERLEGRLLEEDDLFQAMRSAEDDLFDAFARGELTPDDRERFLARFGADRDRIAFARALAARTGPTASRRPSVWIPLAAAAALVVAAGAAWTLRSRRPAEPVPAPPASIAAVQPPAAPVAVPVVALLSLSSTRAAGDRPTIEIPAASTDVDLRVRLNPADRFDRYAMELRSAADAVVWRAGDLKGRVEHGDLFVDARVPAAALPDGVYELAVHGGGSDLGYLSLTIMHKS